MTPTERIFMFHDWWEMDFIFKLRIYPKLARIRSHIVGRHFKCVFEIPNFISVHFSNCRNNNNPVEKINNLRK